MKPSRCVLLAIVWACSGEGTADIGVHAGSLVFAEDSNTGCVTPMSLRGGLPAGVAKVTIRVVRETDGHAAVTRVVTSEDLAGGREILVTGIPEGTYRLVVVGCGPDGSPVWGGRSNTFSVTPAHKAAPIVFMTRAGALNCVGGRNQNPLQPAFEGDDFYVAGRGAFQAAAVSKGQRVLVSGGFVRDEYQATGDVLVAGRHIWEFHPATGVFTGVFSSSGDRLELAEPRAAHGMAAVVAAGVERFVLAGGVSAAVLGPKDYRVKQAPLDAASSVQHPLEVVTLSSSTGAVEPSTKSLPVTYDAVFPSWAFSQDGRTVALAGGRESEDVSASVLVATLNDAVLSETGMAEVRRGTMARKRFGAAAVILSTGELLLVGGSDGKGSAGMEVVRPLGTDGLEAVLLTASLPEGVAATAFASTAVLQDDGEKALILVLGGNPVGGATLFADPVSFNAFLIEIEGDDHTYDPASARTRTVTGVGDWAARSLATLVRAGEGWLLVGGFRLFNALPGVAGCGTTDPVWGDYCFPRTINMLEVDAAAGTVTVPKTWEDKKSRLGVAAVALSSGSVLMLGGVNGAGKRPRPLPPDFDPLLSTGLVWVADDAFDPGLCLVSSGP